HAEEVSLPHGAHAAAELRWSEQTKLRGEDGVALDDVDQEKDDGDDEQNVEQPAERRAGHEPQEPQREQQKDDKPHMFFSPPRVQQRPRPPARTQCDSGGRSWRATGYSPMRVQVDDPDFTNSSAFASTKCELRSNSSRSSVPV